jgi:hypothetical protein
MPAGRLVYRCEMHFAPEITYLGNSDGNEMTGLPSTITSISPDRGRNPNVHRN